jgi:hypothetical protein
VFAYKGRSLLPAQAACALWLALLFRALGSTAENFFSPILTQMSQDMGLPPRLAGGAPSAAAAARQPV